MSTRPPTTISPASSRSSSPQSPTQPAANPTLSIAPSPEIHSPLTTPNPILPAPQLKSILTTILAAVLNSETRITQRLDSTDHLLRDIQAQIARSSTIPKINPDPYVVRNDTENEYADSYPNIKPYGSEYVPGKTSFPPNQYEDDEEEEEEEITEESLAAAENPFGPTIRSIFYRDGNGNGTGTPGPFPRNPRPTTSLSTKNDALGEFVGGPYTNVEGGKDEDVRQELGGIREKLEGIEKRLGVIERLLGMLLEMREEGGCRGCLGCGNAVAVEGEGITGSIQESETPSSSNGSRDQRDISADTDSARQMASVSHATLINVLLDLPTLMAESDTANDNSDISTTREDTAITSNINAPPHPSLNTFRLTYSPNDPHPLSPQLTPLKTHTHSFPAIPEAFEPPHSEPHHSEPNQLGHRGGLNDDDDIHFNKDGTVFEDEDSVEEERFFIPTHPRGRQPRPELPLDWTGVYPSELREGWLR